MDINIAKGIDEMQRRIFKAEADNARLTADLAALQDAVMVWSHRTARDLVRAQKEGTLPDHPGDKLLAVDMVIHCPRCGEQHVDRPDGDWTNPPHKSHLCAGCGCIWRTADIATNGVARASTEGKADNWSRGEGG